MTSPTARTPQGLGWHLLVLSSIRRYIHWETQTVALSELARADLPKSGVPGPQWLVSVSGAGGKRPTPAQVALARCAFGMLDAEEDNHHPGVARHFWLPCDPAERVACECKEDELQVTDVDGYVWSQPTDGPCRGCELAASLLARTGVCRACPVHAEARR